MGITEILDSEWAEFEEKNNLFIARNKTKAVYEQLVSADESLDASLPIGIKEVDDILTNLRDALESCKIAFAKHSEFVNWNEPV